MDWDSAVQRELYRLKVELKEKVDELKEKAKQVGRKPSK